MTAKAMKARVTERALFQRINRALKKEDKILKKCRRDSREYYNLGEYYVVHLASGGVMFHYKDLALEEFAKKLGVLASYEKLED